MLSDEPNVGSLPADLGDESHEVEAQPLLVSLSVPKIIVQDLRPGLVRLRDVSAGENTRSTPIKGGELFDQRHPSFAREVQAIFDARKGGPSPA